MFQQVATINGRPAWQHVTKKDSGIVEANITPDRDERGKARWRIDIEVNGEPFTWAVIYSATKAKNWALDTIGRRIW